MTSAEPSAVVAAYDQRATFAAAEAQHTPTPVALAALLATTRHVAEVPCAGGHYLDAYAAANCRVTLVDANRGMLTAATARAAHAGLPVDQVTAIAAYVQGLPRLTADLLVVPNAALNQLGCQVEPATLFTHLAQAVTAGTRLLAPILCTRSGDVDSSAIYDPHAGHDRWFTDRTFDPPAAGQAVTRLRRQHRVADTLRLDFDYRTADDTSLLSTTVTLMLYPATTVTSAARSAGLTDIHLHTGDGLTDLTATIGAPR